MNRNAYRDENDTDQPDSYWRRRVITLAAGLSLLGVLAWAFSGGGGKPASPSPRSSQTSGVSPAAAYSGAPTSASSGASQTGSAQAGRAIPGLPSASATAASAAASGRSAGAASASANSRTRQSVLGKPGATSTAPAVTPAGGGSGPVGRCSPSAVVLSLFTRPEYYGGQYPQFEVYAVSTAPGACSFDVSPGHLHVVVMSAGRIIWDSADCSRGGEPDRVAELRRGVPAQEPVSWNRSITLPGCVTLASSARLGAYQVQAKTATVSSPVRTFKLARLLLADA